MKFFLTLCLFLFALTSSSSLFTKEVPRLTGPVVDQAKILSSSARSKISGVLKNFKRKSGTQLQVLTVESLDGDTIEDFSIRVVDKWKLGSSKYDRGMLFTVALKERKMRIEVGQGLEGVITDAVAARIIRSVKPYFKQRRFADGIVFALSSMAAQMGGELENLPVRKVKRRRRRSSSMATLLFFIVIGIFSRFSRGRSRGLMGGLMLGAALGSSRHSSGGFGGSSGGGWSGGGGGFSGGGASGGW
jgi:uncharacterized protein